MRQRVPMRVAYDFRRRITAREITLAARIAPSPFRIPMPRYHLQFGVLPVRYSLPTRLEHLLDGRFRKQLFDHHRRHAVDPSAERLVGNELVGGMLRSDVNADGLRG